MGERSVRALLLYNIDQMIPALKYLARVETEERRRADIRGIQAEIAELERVILGDFSEATKDYCQEQLGEMRRRFVALTDQKAIS